VEQKDAESTGYQKLIQLLRDKGLAGDTIDAVVWSDFSLHIDRLFLSSQEFLLFKEAILSLEPNEEFKTLIVSQIDEKFINSLPAICEKNLALTRLEIYHIHFDDENIDMLFNLFRKNSQLTEFVLHSCDIPDGSLKKLSAIWSQDTTLKTLEIKLLNYKEEKSFFNSQGMKLDDIEGLAELLRKNKTISSLALTNNNIGPDKLAMLVSALEENNTLTHLNFALNPLGNEGISVLCQSLAKNDAFKSLDVENTKMGYEGVKVLCNLIKQKSFIHLSIANNDISLEGVEILADALRHNHTLTTLDLGGINIRRVDGVFIRDSRILGPLISAVKNNKNLKTLSIRGSFFEAEEDVNALCELVLTPPIQQ